MDCSEDPMTVCRGELGERGMKEGRQAARMIKFLWRQETAEQGGTGKPTLNHLHCQVHGNAEVGPDGEDVSRAMLTQA